MTMTRVLLIAAMTATAPAVWAKPAEPRQPERRARTVQLISMSADLSPTKSAPLDPLDVRQEESAPPDAFRFHDLSRRWVEHQMAAGLASPAAEAPVSPDVLAATSFPATYSVLPSPASRIAVPAWMRGTPAPSVVANLYAPGCDAAAYRPSGFLALGTEARRQAYYGIMSAIACQYGLPTGLFDAMIIRESGYNPTIVSPKNAFGLTQLMPGTAAGLGVNRFNIEQNLRGGARYLRQQLDRFGQYNLALAAYNAGPGRVRGAVPHIAETRAYVDNVLLNWSRLSGLHRAATVQSATWTPVVPRSHLARNAKVMAF